MRTRIEEISYALGDRASQFAGKYNEPEAIFGCFVLYVSLEDYEMAERLLEKLGETAVNCAEITERTFNG